MFRGLATIAIFLCSFSASAALDIRVSGQSLMLQESEAINDYNGSSFPPLENMNGFAVDAVASLPTMPVSLGVRYESYQDKGANENGSFDAKFERQSILVIKRLIDELFYAGVVFTVGFNNQFTYRKIDALDVKYKATSGATASLGADVGIKFLFLRAGLEGGYMYAPLGNLKFANNGTEVTDAENRNLKIDLAGPYARVLLGVGF